MMTREQLENAPYEAPVTKKIRIGRKMMFIGSILLFLAALGNIVEMILIIVNPSMMAVSLDDQRQFIYLIFLPIASIFISFVSIGGISFVRGKGPFLHWASLGAIILAIYMILDLIIDIRKIAHGVIAASEQDQTVLWIRFIIGIIEIQGFGGVFFFGWLFAKNYLD